MPLQPNLHPGAALATNLCECAEREINGKLKQIGQMADQAKAEIDRLLQQVKLAEGKGLTIPLMDDMIDALDKLEEELDILLDNPIFATPDMPLGRVIECMESEFRDAINQAFEDTGIAALVGGVADMLKQWAGLLTFPALPNLALNLQGLLDNPRLDVCNNIDRVAALADCAASMLKVKADKNGVIDCRANLQDIVSVAPGFISQAYADKIGDLMCKQVCDEIKLKFAQTRVKQVDQRPLNGINLGEAPQPGVVNTNQLPDGCEVPEGPDVGEFG